MANSKSQCKYKNVEKKMTPNGCITRKVVVYENGKGYKSITTHCPNDKTRKNKTVRKPLSESEITDIQNRKFIHGLFNNCT